MIKKLFSGQINSITIAALLVALSSLVSRLLGIFRDRILAGEFGAGDTLDVYYAAFRIPDLVFNLLVLGALSAGFVPVFMSLIKSPLDEASVAGQAVTKIKKFFNKNQNREAWELASSLINILGLGLLLICGLGILLAPEITKLVAPGFDLEKQALTASLTRIMFLSPIFFGISSVFGGVLQSFKRFFVYSLSPIIYNIGIIIGALYLAPVCGVYGLAWGVVLGAFLHMIIQVPAIVGLGFRYATSINFKNKSLREIGTMMIPRTLSLAISQVNLLVITVIASTLASGSLAIFNFANNLQSFPIGIFGISFAIAAFPTLSAVAFDKKELKSNFSNIFRQILFFVVPSTILLLTLRAQIVRVVLGAGQFDWEDTILTINTLGFFTISLFAQASLPLLIRMFYARHDSKTPFIVGLVTAIINLLLSYYFIKDYGVAGLALAFSIANILNFMILWIILRLEIGGLDEVKILFSAIKLSAAALACGISVQGMKLLVWPYIDMTKTLGVLTQGIAAGIAGIVAYVAFCSLFGSEELAYFWEAIKRRLSWKKVEVEDQGEARGL